MIKITMEEISVLGILIRNNGNNYDNYTYSNNQIVNNDNTNEGNI